MSPSAEGLGATKGHSAKSAVEDSTIESSDLDECKEVWVSELQNYALETKKRQEQVAQYFWASIVVSI